MSPSAQLAPSPEAVLEEAQVPQPPESRVSQGAGMCDQWIYSQPGMELLTKAAVSFQNYAQIVGFPKPFRL